MFFYFILVLNQPVLCLFRSSFEIHITLFIDFHVIRRVNSNTETEYYFNGDASES